MQDFLSREELLIGKASIEKLKNSRIAIFGVGGVGGYVLEALVRAGIGHIEVFDKDEFSASNLNRQILATIDTIGKRKVEVAKTRALSINENIDFVAHDMFYLPENADSVDLSKFDYIVDAVDTVSAKIELAKRAYQGNIKIISSMGTGNKLNPKEFEITDISKTSVCPLAKVMRRLCKENGIKKLKVLYSKEEPISIEKPENSSEKLVGSISFCPSVAGLLIASEVVRDLLNK